MQMYHSLGTVLGVFTHLFISTDFVSSNGEVGILVFDITQTMTTKTACITVDVFKDQVYENSSEYIKFTLLEALPEELFDEEMRTTLVQIDEGKKERIFDYMHVRMKCKACSSFEEHVRIHLVIQFVIYMYSCIWPMF